jgi:hypothetical protein
MQQMGFSIFYATWAAVMLKLMYGKGGQNENIFSKKSGLRE